jgi:hypothetical protein
MASSLTRRVRYLMHSAVSLCLATGVLLTTLTFTHTTHGSSPLPMSCCVGESAGHCSSGMAVTKPEPAEAAEPECNHGQGDNSEDVEEDYETVVAESNEATEESTTSHDTPASLTAPCSTDCCPLTWTGFKRPSRDFADPVGRRIVEQDSPRAEKLQNLSEHILTSPHFNRSIPRGPPALVKSNFQA